MHMDAGIVGPYLIGALKSKYGGYTVPMVIMTIVNVFAVLYFAVLLRYLPAKSTKGSTLQPLPQCVLHVS